MALVGKIFEEEKDILYRSGEMKDEQKKALEIARNFRNMGVAIEEIAKATGLSVHEIEVL